MQLINVSVDPLIKQEGFVGMLTGSAVPGEQASSVIINGIKLIQDPEHGNQDSDHNPTITIIPALPFANYEILRRLKHPGLSCSLP